MIIEILFKKCPIVRNDISLFFNFVKIIYYYRATSLANYNQKQEPILKERKAGESYFPEITVLSSLIKIKMTKKCIYLAAFFLQLFQI